MRIDPEAWHLWILSGGNGAGKSTFYRVFLKPHGIHFVNADNIAKTLKGILDPVERTRRAQEMATLERDIYLETGTCFCFETVFSHPSKVEFIERATEKGYQVTLVYIHLSSTALNKLRVVQRVREGEHDVPHDKIESRIPRLMKNIQTVIPMVPHVWLLDNSSRETPFKEVAIISNGQITGQMTPLPDWAAYLLTHLP